MSIDLEHKVNKNTWFCGCPIKHSLVNAPADPWSKDESHENYFNKQKLRREFICMTNGIVLVADFKVKFISK